jgi:hypothetical protein
MRTMRKAMMAILGNVNDFIFVLFSGSFKSYDDKLVKRFKFNEK